MTISTAKRLALRAAFDRGETPTYAAHQVGVAQQTAARHFLRLGWDRSSPRKRKPRVLQRAYDVPVYTGPDWIGKAITPPSDPAGQPAID